MTVYTNASLTDFYIDESDPPVSDFVDDLGNDVIIADELDAEPETGPASFFGYPILTLLHTADPLAVHLKNLLSEIDADNRLKR